jgi:hypothetical protein
MAASSHYLAIIPYLQTRIYSSGTRMDGAGMPKTMQSQNLTEPT